MTDNTATATATAFVHSLQGVDHTARPTWKLRETVEFYRDKLGLPLVHVISARGWGPSTHPDFLHFFFDSGKGSTIAFFYYLGADIPPAIEAQIGTPPLPNDHVFDATHTAWTVESAEDLRYWKTRLESKGLTVSVETTHEVIESIYVRDPNGYFVEFTRKLRALDALDARDAEKTLEAAMAAEDVAREAGSRVTHIDQVWLAKAEMLDGIHGTPESGVRIYVPRLEEFSSLTQAAMSRSDCTVRALGDYDVVESEGPIEFERKALGLKPAVWYGLFTGGVRGDITTFDRDRVVIHPVA